jgi:hypothetical protein
MLKIANFVINVLTFLLLVLLVIKIVILNSEPDDDPRDARAYVTPVRIVE